MHRHISWEKFCPQTVEQIVWKLVKSTHQANCYTHLNGRQLALGRLQTADSITFGQTIGKIGHYRECSLIMWWGSSSFMGGGRGQLVFSSCPGNLETDGIHM